MAETAPSLRVRLARRLMASPCRLLLRHDSFAAAAFYARLWQRLAGEDPQADLALGTAYQGLMQPARAIEPLRRAAAALPDDWEACLRLGVAAQDAHDWATATESFERLVTLAPESAEPLYHLGNAHFGAGRHREAIAAFEAALAIESVASTHNGLGLALADSGQVRAALPHFDAAVAHSQNPVYHSNRLFIMGYDAGISPQTLFEAHREFGQRFAKPERTRWPNQPDPDRPLRVGYLSPDLHQHPVSQFLLPVLAHHDRNTVKVYVYDTQSWRADATTAKLRAHAQSWHGCDDPLDPDLAQQILDDRIDILVELAGHTANNSLPLLAGRLAPVQVSWLGYLNTTGLATIDWRLTDATACPSDFAGPLHTERLAYLPDSHWCYEPPDDAPPVASLPALTSPWLTLGVLHNPAKIGPEAIAAWIAILEAVPNTRLLLVARAHTELQALLASALEAAGLAPERLMVRPSQHFRDYLALHGEIDINLDTFPYTGGTTTCHSLWMGVPVLTLAWPSLAGRGGASLLRAIGLEDWIVDTPQALVERVAHWSATRSSLATLRSGLRARMADSPLCDGARFTRALEDRYRAMWQDWCGRQATPSSR
jgi:predicted O-linked N-acetylglucosamine transferase (SPINDLY family)